MRNGSLAALVITMLLAGSGKLNAQTVETQQTVETRFALRRLACGVRIAESIQTLAEAAVEEPLRNLRKAGVYLRHLYERLDRQGGKPRSGKRFAS
jgi:hypothetical protein